jgi:ferritin-like protein
MDIKIESPGADVSKRFPIKLPAWHEKYLIWWASLKGVSKTALAQNTLQARLEANKEQIEEMLADRARDLGISVDELKARLLEASNPTTPDEPD